MELDLGVGYGRRASNRVSPQPSGLRILGAARDGSCAKNFGSERRKMTTTAAVTTRQVTLSHGKTRYLEAGTGHPVILLHGVAIAGGSDDWRPAIEHLAGRYRILAPDFVGWPPGDTYAGMDAFPYLTDFVREFQDALGLKSS